METPVIYLLLGSWILLLSIGSWVVTRMNLQVRRLSESPTPKESFKIIGDLLESQDLLVMSIQRKSNQNEALIDDMMVRIRGIQARLNAEARKNDQVDTVALADYIQQGQEAAQETPAQAASNFDQNAGEDIDYR